jgi:hypothetical protein
MPGGIQGHGLAGDPYARNSIQATGIEVEMSGEQGALGEVGAHVGAAGNGECGVEVGAGGGGASAVAEAVGAGEVHDGHQVDTACSPHGRDGAL